MSTSGPGEFLHAALPSRVGVEEYCDWHLLDTTARGIVDEVLRKWKVLLLETHREEVYQKFLAEHAALFFFNGFDPYLVLSKVRLGADHVTDFAMPIEKYSRGLFWNLVELEVPHCAPYTKRGDPSRELSHGIQQIQDWKRWLISNRDEARRVFPCLGVRTLRDPNFRFTLIIGTRENSARHLERRNQMADSLKIRIHSFDYLSTLLQHHTRHNELILLDGDFRFPRSLANRLASPFTMAIPDQDWRALLKDSSGLHSPYLPGIAELLAERRPYNNKLLSKFVARFNCTMQP